VDVTWQCGDVLSGVTAQTVARHVGSEGDAQSATQSCVDVAGNTASNTVGTIRIDLTPPTVACSPDPAVLWPPNNKMVDVDVSLTFTDALSGPWSFAMNQASSSDGGTGDIAGFTVGSTSLSGSLRAKRSGNSSGRVYTLGYMGRDRAGNTAACSTEVEVPHDRSQK